MTESKKAAAAAHASSAFAPLERGEWKRVPRALFGGGHLDRGEQGGKGDCLFHCVAASLAQLGGKCKRVTQQQVRAAAAEGILVISARLPRLGRDVLAALSEFEWKGGEAPASEEAILAGAVAQVQTPGWYGTHVVLQAITALSMAAAAVHARSVLCDVWMALAPRALVFLVVVVDRDPSTGRIRCSRSFLPSLDPAPSSAVYVMLLNDRTAASESLAHYQLLRSRMHKGTVLLTAEQLRELDLV